MSDVQAANLIFCDMSVFTNEERERHIQVSQDLFARVTELRETDEGYALRLPDEAGIILKIADFINDDRRCCQYIHFGMEVEPQQRGIWLTLEGDANVNMAIRGELLNFIPDAILT